MSVNRLQERTLVVQAGAYGEHAITDVVDGAGQTTAVNAGTLRVRLAPGSGGKFTLHVKRHAQPPTFALPYE